METDTRLRIPTARVLGQTIACLGPDELTELIRARSAPGGGGGYACFTNAYSLVMAGQDREFAMSLAGATCNLADGKPVYWLARALGWRRATHLPGPDFLEHCLEHDTVPPLRHYFFGSSEYVLERLTQNLRRQFPHAQIVGAESPPFRLQTESEEAATLTRIRQCGADVVWVGLGAPKQEVWMNGWAERLAPAFLVGVGAAFDFHAGTVPRGPRWLRRLGLEWAFRLCSEPRRLWRRYLVGNSMFLWLGLKALLAGDPGTERDREST